MLQGIQGIEGYPAVPKMFEAEGLAGMPNLQALLAYQKSRAAGAGEQKAKEEFLAIFYKELLKQAFKPPSFGFESGDNSSSLTGTFASDLLMERMALELARSKAFSGNNLFPTGFEK